MMTKCKNIRSFLRGLYYLICRPNTGFVKEEQRLKDKYYSIDAPKNNVHETIIILMIDGRSIHGGLTDRLRGITTIYEYCKRKHITFKLNYVYPFQLTDYLVPVSYDWRIQTEDISYNSNQATVAVLNDYQLDIRLHKYYLDSIIRHNKNKQIHIYTNTYFLDRYFTESFRELFHPTVPLKSAIEANLKHIGNKYVAMVFRFQQLLGDFKEDGYKMLSISEQESLIQQCIKEVDKIRHANHPNNIVLVTSDSGKFLQKIVEYLDYVRIIPGKVVHMDHTANAAFETYMKSFEDMFLLEKADKIYLLQTGDMYHSGFAKRAAMIDDKEYEEIIF